MSTEDIITRTRMLENEIKVDFVRIEY
jgi:hypothetical protein